MTSETPSVCVHGLGYVGLPTAAVLANSGYQVYGYDADEQLRNELRAGDLKFDERDLERFVQRAFDDGLTIIDDVRAADFHIICVPTPYNKDLDRTDLTYVEAAGAAIEEVLRADDSVVLSSTVPPGTTEGLLRSVLETSGLSAREDFFLGYSPETVLPGNTLAELRENDRLVGTVEERAPDRIVALYDSFVSGDIRTTDATSAEFVKLIQNAYRDVNIAFANEVAKLAHEFSINSRENIALANKHPRVDILRPGPGVGGHCIPVDPLFLNHNNDIPMLIETARTVNDGMPGFIIELLSTALDKLEEATVTLLGVAYKGGVGDIRESPALALARELEQNDVSDIRLTDPYVDAEDLEWELCSLEQGLDRTDAAIITTDHPEYGALNPSTFSKAMVGSVIIDTRAMIDSDRWQRSGFDIYTI